MKKTVNILVLMLVFGGLISTAQAVEYSGRIVNDIGRPAAGATITITRLSDPGEVYSAVTDTTGVFSFVITSVTEEKPIPFKLYGNFPNPFNPSTRISYSLDTSSDVTISIYNILGQQVRTIDHGFRAPGFYTAVWDGRDDSGSVGSAGVYLYRLSAGGRRLTSKMLMVDAATGSWISDTNVPTGVFKTSGDMLYVISVTSPDINTLTLGPLTLNASSDTLLTVERIMNKMEMVYANTYMRGTNKRQYLYVYPEHPIKISNNFLMDKYDVTTVQFCDVMNHALGREALVLTDEYAMNAEGDSKKLFLYQLEERLSNLSIAYVGDRFVPKEGNEKIPISCVSWYGAMFYCYERNIIEGFPQSMNLEDWSYDIKSTGYRLPTDSEWELAAKWTDNREYAFGPDPGHYKPMNVQLNDDGFSNVLSPVGWFAPQGNSHDGLCDLSGNVYEWVLDWQGEYSTDWVNTVQVDPLGRDWGRNKICRGGSAMGCFRSARTFDKAHIFIEDTLRNVGLRTMRIVKD